MAVSHGHPYKPEERRSKEDDTIEGFLKVLYLDGYSPEQIIHAAHRKIRQEYEAREAARRAEAEAMEIPEVKITSEVRIK